MASQMVRRPACPSAVQCSALKWGTESMPRPPAPGVRTSSGLPFHFSYPGFATSLVCKTVIKKPQIEHFIKKEVRGQAV